MRILPLLLFATTAHAGWADDSPIPVNTPAAQEYNAKLDAIMVRTFNDWDCKDTTTTVEQCQVQVRAWWRWALNQVGALYFNIPADEDAIRAARDAIFTAGCAEPSNTIPQCP